MDHFHDKWEPYKETYTFPPPILPWPQPATRVEPPISDAEIQEFRKLLERAREYDKKNHEPECELKEKREKLLALAGELGIKIDFV